jgi:hypothetical protein
MALFFQMRWAVAAVVIILGSAAWWFSSTRPTVVLPPNRPATFHWSSGCRASYDFSVSTDTVFGGQRAVSYRLFVTGTLNMRVFRSAEKITAAFHLSPVMVTADGRTDDLLETLYATPFTVQMNRNGLIAGFDFPQGLPAEDRDMIIQLIGGLETVLPENGKALYTARQDDRMGTFVAKYRRNAGGGSRQKLHYVDNAADTHRQLPLITRIIDSGFDFTLDPEGCWLKALSGEERIRVAIGKDDFYTEAVTRITLQRQATMATDTVLWSVDDLESLLKPLQRHAAEGSVREVRNARALDEVLQAKGRTLQELLNTQWKNEDAALRLLKRYLETHPEAAEQIPELLLSGQWPDEVAVRTILALGLTGSAAAQNALIAIWRDPAFSEGNRLQAVHAFTGLKQPPTEAAFTALTSQIHHLRAGEPDSDLAATPVMISGIVIQNIRENYPETASQLNKELLYLLDSTHDSAQVNTLLLALGNSHMEENAEVIGRYITDPDPGIRETAVRMAGRYSGEESSRALLAQLPWEDEPAVQEGILKSLYGQPLQAGDLESVQTTLETASDEDVRAAAIETLAAHKHLDPDAVNAVLQNAYRQETSRENIKRIVRAFHRHIYN